MPRPISSRHNTQCYTPRKSPKEKMKARQKQGAHAESKFRREVKQASYIARLLDISTEDHDMESTLRSMRANSAFQAVITMSSSSLVGQDSKRIVDTARKTAKSWNYSGTASVLAVLLLLMSGISRSCAAQSLSQS